MGLSILYYNIILTIIVQNIPKKLSILYDAYINDWELIIATLNISLSKTYLNN